MAAAAAAPSAARVAHIAAATAHGRATRTAQGAPHRRSGAPHAAGAKAAHGAPHRDVRPLLLLSHGSLRADACQTPRPTLRQARDHYDALGVPRTASPLSIKRAFVRLAHL
eukprot:6021078-Prymnesium_polylepis.1